MSVIVRDMMEQAQLQNIDIHSAGNDEASRLWSIVETLGYAKESGYFERLLEYQARGERSVFIGQFKEQDVSYCILNWKPKYGFFKKLEIPEIQDLNVLPGFRRQGIATSMISYCENLAVQKGFAQMGIGVGLNASYGPAQRLYVRLGYVPDGNGVCCDRQQVANGEFRPIDDQLCLMMVKDLNIRP